MTHPTWLELSDEVNMWAMDHGTDVFDLPVVLSIDGRPAAALEIRHEAGRIVMVGAWTDTGQRCPNCGDLVRVAVADNGFPLPFAQRALEHDTGWWLWTVDGVTRCRPVHPSMLGDQATRPDVDGVERWWPHHCRR